MFKIVIKILEFINYIKYFGMIYDFFKMLEFNFKSE